jgi:lysophospholipase L1-like esterase
LRRAHRNLFLLAYCALAAGVAWFAFERLRPRPQPTLEFFEAPKDALVPVQPGAAQPADASGGGLDPATPQEWRWFVPEDLARQVFPIGREDIRYEPWTHFRQQGGLHRRVDWPEAPEGGFELRTNRQGLREDREIPSPPADRRVLVAGDSHTFGYCANADSFANLLEARLSAERPLERVEVLNAASPGFTFYEYEGTLHRFRAFEPQVFVVGVYAGNDFAELGAVYPVFFGKPLGSLSAEQMELRAKARGAAPYSMGQCFNSISRFRWHPEEAELLVGLAAQICGRMQGICELRKCRMIVVLLPAACDCNWRGSHEDMEHARSLLELSEAENRINDELASSFLAQLASAGIDALDMRPIFDAQAEPPYWRTDLHLSTSGQRLVAEALLPVVEARLR